MAVVPKLFSLHTVSTQHFLTDDTLKIFNCSNTDTIDAGYKNTGYKNIILEDGSSIYCIIYAGILKGGSRWVDDVSGKKDQKIIFR